MVGWLDWQNPNIQMKKFIVERLNGGIVELKNAILFVHSFSLIPHYFTEQQW
jgi:hypothetical protein